MKIVIDIDEKIYNDIRSKNEHGKIFNAVKNGTPLPKGHGRLIDADAMQKYQIDTFGQRLLLIDTAPTIIEAESEDKE